MTDNQAETTKLFNADENVKSISLDKVKKTYSFVWGLLTNLVCLAVLISTGWYCVVQPYVRSIESQLSEAVFATRGVATLSEIKNLQQSLDALKDRIVSLEHAAVPVADLQKELKFVQLKLSEFERETSRTAHIAKSKEWKDAISKAILNAAPLEAFRQTLLIPEKIREMMVGVDFIPTSKNISDNWSLIRNAITFKDQAALRGIPDSAGWWGRFKMFLKSMFKVQRLNNDNLTAEEVFVRQVDKLLIENEFSGVIEWTHKHAERFDIQTQALIKDWVKKLNIYQQGQLILKMVNESND